MKKYDKIKNNVEIESYDIEKYFNKNDENSKFIITNIFKKNINENIFFIINEEHELEIFFNSSSFIDIPDDSIANINITAYYKGVLHFEITLFNSNKIPIDLKKFTFCFSEIFDSRHLPELVTIVENEKIILNYFIIEDNEIDIYKRLESKLLDKEVKKIKNSIELFYSKDNENNEKTDFYYSNDIQIKELDEDYHFYEIENDNILDLEKLKDDLENENDLIICSVVDSNSKYIASNKKIDKYLNIKNVKRNFQDKLLYYYFFIDYITKRGEIYRVYNDVKTNVDLKYYCYNNYCSDVLKYRDNSQDINNLVENNYYNYYLMKYAFLNEKKTDKKVFYAVNLLSFYQLDNFETIFDFIIKYQLDKYLLKYSAKSIGKYHRDKFTGFVEQFDSSNEREVFNIEEIGNYIYFYKKMEKIKYLVNHYDIDEIEKLDEMLISALIEFNKDFLDILISLPNDIIKKILNVYKKDKIERYLNSLRDEEDLKDVEIEIKLMDLKQSFMDIISFIDDELFDDFEKAIKNIFY